MRKMLWALPMLFLNCHYLARCSVPFIGVASMGPVRDTTAVVRVMVKSATEAHVVYYPDKPDAWVTEGRADLKEGLVIAEISGLKPDTDYWTYVKGMNECPSGPLSALSNKIRFRTRPKLR
jgi:hypothetical protein